MKIPEGHCVYLKVSAILWGCFALCECNPSPSLESNWVVKKGDLSELGVSFEDFINFSDYHGALVEGIGVHLWRIFDANTPGRVEVPVEDSIVVNTNILDSGELSIDDLQRFARDNFRYEWVKKMEQDVPKLMEKIVFSNYESKDDLTPSRNSPDEQLWKKQIHERDNVCQCCGHDKKLHVHHIFGRKNYPELRCDENNGILLCKWCHQKYHSIYGIKNPNPVSFGEYMRKYGRS